MAAVSYTHLDVYKRQEFYAAIRTPEPFLPAGTVIAREQTYVHTFHKEDAPVSYTHLDVYKRQLSAYRIPVAATHFTAEHHRTLFYTGSQFFQLDVYKRQESMASLC